jgi:hypothetical protein
MSVPEQNEVFPAMRHETHKINGLSDNFPGRHCIYQRPHFSSFNHSAFSWPRFFFSFFVSMLLTKVVTLDKPLFSFCAVTIRNETFRNRIPNVTGSEQNPPGNQPAFQFNRYLLI